MTNKTYVFAGSRPDFQHLFKGIAFFEVLFGETMTCPHHRRLQRAGIVGLVINIRKSGAVIQPGLIFIISHLILHCVWAASLNFGAAYGTVCAARLLCRNPKRPISVEPPLRWVTPPALPYRPVLRRLAATS